MDDAASFWQIHPVAVSGNHGRDMLSEAPIGLFTMTQKGRLLAQNEVLLQWIGVGETENPRHISNFIEEPGLILDSLAEPGRTVRADTRLITRKGVVSPIVMVANWHELNAGDIVASVALYGHSKRAQDVELPGNEPVESEFVGAGYEAAPVAVLKLEGTVIGEATIRSANPAFLKMSGEADVIDGAFKDLFADDETRLRFLSRDVSELSLIHI